ncbi:UDP-glucose/GDP-mannose dehydrogenase family protein [Pseudomonadota bacterium]|nr:UDP-glucose/GDP-mannose dehydrogenase family protein [Pseudomonadota bacterium]
MNIGIIGVGYVGLVTGVGFAHFKNKVVCFDIDQNKINDLNNGDLPIYEEGLDEYLEKAIDSNLISFTNNLDDCISSSDIIFLCVGTPQDKAGAADLKYLIKAVDDIVEVAKKDLILVCKSTVPVGTCDKIEKRINLSHVDNRSKFKVVSNPEFLKEGTALKDFLEPDRVVLGIDDSDYESSKVFFDLYAEIVSDQSLILVMPRRDAELTKYAANAMLATKISFINEIAVISDKYDADIKNIQKGIGADPRIGYEFLNPGCGYGGSCFPKDVKALINKAKEKNIESYVLGAVDKRNELQKKYLADKVKSFFFNKENVTVSIWGLSFKPNTDDIRCASSLDVITELLDSGFKIKAYDPISNASVEEYFNDIGSDTLSFEINKYDALKESHGLILLTEWDEFKSFDFSKADDLMLSKNIFDGRNFYDKDEFLSHDWKYSGIGR